MQKARLIDANALRNKICAACAERSICTDMGNVCFEVACIDNAPTIDAEPVRDGRWIPYYSDESYNVTNVFICSECGKSARFIMAYHECEYGFCPHCGARMYGGAENANN